MTRQYRAGVREALLAAYWKKQGGICYGTKIYDPSGACLVGKPIIEPVVWSRLPGGERKRLARAEPTLDHVEMLDHDDLKVRGVVHRACNTAIQKLYDRRARIEKALRDQGLTPSEGPAAAPSGQAKGREKQASVPFPSPASIDELEALLPEGVKLSVVRENDSYSNRRNRECEGPFFMEAFREMKRCTEAVGKDGSRGVYHPYDELNDALAAWVGEVPKSTGGYLDLLCSLVGPFKETAKTQGNISVVTWREPHYAMLEVGELYTLWNPAGLKNVHPELKERLLKEATERWEARERALIERFGVLEK
ncbi:MAG: hypothetical protein KGI38_12245 [Thaumarchaeota archaeon]|nr:hypothetical protein [Nitrososphaerota archaeon]